MLQLGEPPSSIVAVVDHNGIGVETLEDQAADFQYGPRFAVHRLRLHRALSNNGIWPHITTDAGPHSSGTMQTSKRQLTCLYRFGNRNLAVHAIGVKLTLSPTFTCTSMAECQSNVVAGFRR
jgi:hypothetical protein